MTKSISDVLAGTRHGGAFEPADEIVTQPSGSAPLSRPSPMAILARSVPRALGPFSLRREFAPRETSQSQNGGGPRGNEMVITPALDGSKVARSLNGSINYRVIHMKSTVNK